MGLHGRLCRVVHNGERQVCRPHLHQEPAGQGASGTARPLRCTILTWRSMPLPSSVATLEGLMLWHMLLVLSGGPQPERGGRLHGRLNRRCYACAAGGAPAPLCADALLHQCEILHRCMQVHCLHQPAMLVMDITRLPYANSLMLYTAVCLQCQISGGTVGKGL